MPQPLHLVAETRRPALVAIDLIEDVRPRSFRGNHETLVLAQGDRQLRKPAVGADDGVTGVV